MRYFLGVDPGVSGASCVVDRKGNFVKGVLHKSTEKEISQWYNGLEEELSDLCLDRVDFDIDLDCIIEKVHAMPKQGISSSFKFGRNFGFLLSCLYSNRYRFKETSPTVWQRKMNCLTKGNKNITKVKAEQLFPNVKVTHANADALIIALYCREIFK